AVEHIVTLIRGEGRLETLEESDRTLDCADYISQADLFRLPGKEVPTPWTPDTHHNSGQAHLAEKLLKISGRNIPPF
ncbi:hypothetical protein AMJ39_07215, partial [candidate division TA06 bacterium DG_24]